MNSQYPMVRRESPDAQPPVLYRYHEALEDEGGGFSLDLSELRAMLFRQRWWVAASVAAAVLAGLVATMLTTPIYRATGTVQIEANLPIVEEGGDAVGQQTTVQNMGQVFQAQIDVLKSRNLATRVARQLGLDADAAFLNGMGIDGGDGTGGRKALQAQVVGELQENLIAELPPGSQTARISFDSPDPELSARIANAYAENLITGNIERRYEASAYARQFLSKELEAAKTRLETSERAALAYARSAQVVDTGGGASAMGAAGGGGGGGTTSSLSAASLVQMNNDLAAARTARIQAEQRWRTAAGTPVMSLPEVIDNGTIAGLQGERARLTSQLGKLRQTFQDDYPDVQRLRTEIASTEREIGTIANQVRNSIRERYEVAASQEGAMSSRMAGLKSATLNEQDLRVRFDILNRESATNRELYAALLQRYREVSTAAGVTTNNVSVLDAAVPVPSPIRPRPLVNMALATLAGLALGLLIAFVRERLDDTIRSPADVLDKLRLPLLGTTPVLPPRTMVQALASPKSQLSEAYHSIRSSIEFASANGFPRTLLVTSSRAAEGKSTTSLALARNFVSLGHKVLLIDADLRLPSLHRALDVANDVGLVHVLIGKMKLSDAVQPLEDLTFLPSGPIPPNPTDLLASHNVGRFLHDALNGYDVIVIDGPPVMGLADSPQLARVVEGTLLVVEASRANRGHVRTAIRRLAAANANVLGIVLTKFSARQSGYEEDYGYSYKYGASGDAKMLTA